MLFLFEICDRESESNLEITGHHFNYSFCYHRFLTYPPINLHKIPRIIFNYVIDTKFQNFIRTIRPITMQLDKYTHFWFTSTTMCANRKLFTPFIFFSPTLQQRTKKKLPVHLYPLLFIMFLLLFNFLYRKKKNTQMGWVDRRRTHENERKFFVCRFS